METLRHRSRLGMRSLLSGSTASPSSPHPPDRHPVLPARNHQEHGAAQAGKLITHTISRMEMPRAHPRWGIEFDWLGLDQRGHIAVFTTAGYGAVPENVNAHLNDVDRAIDHLRRMPVIGKTDQIVKPASEGNYGDWYTYSAQGFYAYDWRVWGGPYLRLSVPTVPIAIRSLPPSMQAVARYATFELDFAEASQINVEYREPPTQ